MADRGLERRAVKQSGSENVQSVEPATSLTNILNDVIARVVSFEPLTVFKRVVNLRERHRTRLKPAVENLWNAAHG